MIIEFILCGLNRQSAEDSSLACRILINDSGHKKQKAGRLKEVGEKACRQYYFIILITLKALTLLPLQLFLYASLHLVGSSLFPLSNRPHPKLHH